MIKNLTSTKYIDIILVENLMLIGNICLNKKKETTIKNLTFTKYICIIFVHANQKHITNSKSFDAQTCLLYVDIQFVKKSRFITQSICFAIRNKNSLENSLESWLGLGVSSW